MRDEQKHPITIELNSGQIIRLEAEAATRRDRTGKGLTVSEVVSEALTIYLSLVDTLGVNGTRRIHGHTSSAGYEDVPEFIAHVVKEEMKRWENEPLPKGPGKI